MSNPVKSLNIILRNLLGGALSRSIRDTSYTMLSSNLSESEIYDAMIIVNSKEKITISKLANYLGCSTRTIYRNMGNELKKEKELLNRQL